jgi:hypothetical protein
MRQQWHDGVFNTRSECRPFCRPASQRFFTITDQELVELKVGTNDGQVSNAWSKQNFVNIGAKLDLPPKKFSHFGAFAIASVGQSHLGRHKSNATQLAAQADRDGCETLDLVAVRMAAYTNITVSHPTVLSANVPQS